MSRITQTEAEVRDVAAKLRQYRIPSDVLHLDTGWFETDWQSNYEFSTTRFTNPRAMISDLARNGFHISLWQYTYFTRKNKISDELFRGGLAVRNEAGMIGDEDATLDFSNPTAVQWYQGKLESLLTMGVGVIKADFGEGAPLTGLYASGRTGGYEHNLYPVRYNKAAWEITKRATGSASSGDGAREAGSQRYGCTWGGDAETRTRRWRRQLRGGLSLGLSRFTYWSHDIGGFVNRAPRELYRRWTPFGRCRRTRAPTALPAEPWSTTPRSSWISGEPSSSSTRSCRTSHAQAKASSEKGYPMMRTPSSSTRTMPHRGSSRTSTSSAPTCWSPRSSTTSITARCTCRQGRGSTTRPAARTRVPRGTTFGLGRFRSFSSSGTAP